MKKNLVVLLSCLSLAALSIDMNGKCINVNAASLLDDTLVENFGQGLDTEKFTKVNDEANSFKLFDTTGQGMLGLSSMTYGQAVVTKDVVTIPEGKDVVVQFDLINYNAGTAATAGFLSEFNGAAEGGAGGWTNMLCSNIPGVRIMKETGSVGGYQIADDAVASGLTTWGGSQWAITNSAYRRIYHTDGSADLYHNIGSVAESGLNRYFHFDAGTFATVNTGYYGFSGNGLVGELKIDNYKVGYLDGDAITWVFNDDFESSEKWQAQGAGTTFTAGSAKYFSVENPANGAGIVCNTELSSEGNQGKVFQAEFDVKIDELNSGALGVAFNVKDEAELSSKDGIYVGKDDDGYYLTTTGDDKEYLPDSVIGSSQTLELNAEVTEEGKVNVQGLFGGKEVNIELDSIDGKLAIAALGTCEYKAQIEGFTLNTYKGVYENGRTLSTDFSTELNKNWYLSSHNNAGADDPDCVKVVDNELRFHQAGDGSFFGTKYKYVNFELQFDVKVQQFDETDDGEILKPSTWVGISMGKQSLDQLFAETALAYFGTDCLDTLNMNETGRCWLTTDSLFHETNRDKFVTIRLVAKDGTVEVYTKKEGAEEVKKATYENVDTDGYVSICCTAGGDFTIRNYSITNLDGNEATNAAPVVADGENEVSAGQTVTGTLTGTDADEDELFFEVVEDKTTEAGTLTVNKDGTYSFVANDHAKQQEVSFTYKATDTEDDSNVATVTLKINNEKPVAADVTESVTAGETLTSSVSATDPENDTLTYAVVEDNTADKGTLTFNADGTYSFVANAATEDATVTFTYKAADEANDSNVATVTINIAKKEVEEPSVEPSETPSEEPSVEPSEATSQEPTSEVTSSDKTSEEPTPETPKKKGCKGVATGGFMAAILGGLGALFIRRRKEDK